MKRRAFLKTILGGIGTIAVGAAMPPMAQAKTFDCKSIAEMNWAIKHAATVDTVIAENVNEVMHAPFDFRKCKPVVIIKNNYFAVQCDTPNGIAIGDCDSRVYVINNTFQWADAKS